MTVQIEIDEKQWAEAETLAKELNIDYNEMFINTFRASLYNLKNAKDKAFSIEEKERKHRESYEKFPQKPEEFEVWEDLQDWGDV